LKCGDIKVPISLSYDATGIRAETHPTWVGLNWNLKAGGKITRIVKGEPDEKSVKVSPCSSTGYDREYVTGYFYAKGWLSDPAWNQEETLLLWAFGEFVPDLEPDEFVFNFCGQSGVFYLDCYNQWVVKGLKGYTITPFLQILPWNPIDYYNREGPCYYMTDTDWASSKCFKVYTNYILGFKMVDPDGYTYYFGFGDTTLSTSDCYTRDFSEVETSASLFDQYHIPEINAWNLMKIVSPTGHTVTFEYQPGPRQAQLNKQFSYNTQWFDKTSAFFSDTRTITYQDSQLIYAGDIIRPSYLKRIVSDAETVEFTRTPTQDITYNYNKIYDNLNCYKGISENTSMLLTINDWYGVLDSKYTYKYTYPTGMYAYPTYYAETYSPREDWAVNMGSGEGYLLARCLSKSGQKLDSIHIRTQGVPSGQGDINFTFDYIDRPTSRLQLTSIHSNGLPMYEFIYNGTCDFPYATGRSDHWGYISSNDINSYDYLEDYFNYAYDYTSVSTYEPDVSALNSFFNERTSDYYYPCYGGYLTGIKYPTGGTKEFFFEPNIFTKCITRNAVTGALSIVGYQYEIPGGGLRIAKIIENDTKSTTTTSYEYSGGILNGMPQYCFNQNGKYYTSFNKFSEFNAEKFISTSIVPVSTNPDFSSVTYSKVIERQDGNGRIEYTFSNHDTDTSYIDKNSEGIITLTKTAYTPLTSRVAMRGKLLEKKTFGQGDTPVKVETFTYELLDDEYIRAVSLRRQVYQPPYTAESFYSIEGAAYRIYTSPYVLKTHAEHYLYPNGSIVSDSTVYTYDQYYQVATKTEIGSGNTTTTTFKYPYNYYDPVHGDMVNNRNIITPVIEQITTRNGNVTAAQQTEYMLTNEMYLPSSAYSLNAASPVSPSSYSQYYSKDTNFDQYDSHGNVVQYTGKDGIPITYLWSYHGEYPVAEIRNATYTDVSAILGGSYITQLSNSVVINDSDISALNTLRSSLPNALISIYTYKPLVGLISKTDPSGRTTSYDYDQYGRLIMVKDDKGQVLESYYYHYKEN